MHTLNKTELIKDEDLKTIYLLQLGYKFQKFLLGIVI